MSARTMTTRRTQPNSLFSLNVPRINSRNVIGIMEFDSDGWFLGFSLLIVRPFDPGFFLQEILFRYGKHHAECTPYLISPRPSVSSIETPQGSTMVAVAMWFMAGSFLL